MPDYFEEMLKRAKEKKKTPEEPKAPDFNEPKLAEKFLNQKMDELNIPARPAVKGPEIRLTAEQMQIEKIRENKNMPNAITPLSTENTPIVEYSPGQKTLVESYGEAKIYKVQGSDLFHYEIPVPKPTAGEKAIINAIKEAATRLISIAPYRIRDPQQKRNVYYQKIQEILHNSPELNIPENRFDFYSTAVVREMVGYGIIDLLIQDDRLEEIMIISAKRPVYVFHRQYEMMTTNIEFYNDDEIQDLVNRIAREVGRRVDISSPLLDARLPDGSRVNATVPPASVEGSSLTIRKFRKDPYTLIDLIKMKTLNLETAAFLWLCVDGLGTKPGSILISGGTGSGKTSTLNVLSSLIPERERIITIEDTAELNLPIKHWIRLEGRPPGLEGTGELTLDILTKNALRMRPDRIIVGEVRHAEAFTLFTALNTGHDGCLTPETKIALTNGISDIGSFVDGKLSEKNTWKENDWQVANVENDFINSLDENGKIYCSSIKQVRRRPFDGTVYHIKMASGNEITCTGNHPVYSFEKGLAAIKAEELSEGQFVATPSRLVRDATVNEPEIEYWSGLLHGDGSILQKIRMREKNGKTYACHDSRVSLYTEESDAVPSFIRFMREQFHQEHLKIVNPRPEKNCYEVHASGVEMTKKVIEQLDILAGSRQKTFMSNSHYQNDLRSFVAGFFDAEGHVDIANNAMVFTNANEEYIDFFKYALLTEGIRSRKYESNSSNSRWYRLYVYGIDQARKFATIYPIRFGEKRKKLLELINKKAAPNTNVNIVPCNDLLIDLLKQAKKIGFSQQAIAGKAGVSQGLLNFYVQRKRMPSKETLPKLVLAFESIGLDCTALHKLAESDIFWDRVIAIHSHAYNGFVYDLTLNEAVSTGTKPHNFVADGIIVGNSMGTVHANSPEETLVRVTSPPMNVPQTMLAGLDFVIVENRLHDKKKGTIRRITEISQVIGALEGNVKTQNIFEWNPVNDEIERTVIPIQYLKKLQKFTGFTKEMLEMEIEKRKQFLKKMVEQDVHELAPFRQKIMEFFSQ